MRPSFFQEILSGGNVRNRSLNVTAWALAIAAGALSPTDAFGQKKQRDLITREEIESVTQSSADLYEVVRKLRPQFLEPPKGQRTMPAGMRWDTRRDVGGSSGIAAIMVAVDGRLETSIESLKTISPVLVQEVRYLDPSRAQNQFGLKANGGAIVVSMKKDEPAKEDRAAKPKDPPPA